MQRNDFKIFLRKLSIFIVVLVFVQSSIFLSWLSFIDQNKLNPIQPKIQEYNSSKSDNPTKSIENLQQASAVTTLSFTSSLRASGQFPPGTKGMTFIGEILDNNNTPRVVAVGSGSVWFTDLSGKFWFRHPQPYTLDVQDNVEAIVSPDRKNLFVAVQGNYFFINIFRFDVNNNLSRTYYDHLQNGAGLNFLGDSGGSYRPSLAIHNGLIYVLFSRGVGGQRNAFLRVNSISSTGLPSFTTLCDMANGGLSNQICGVSLQMFGYDNPSTNNPNERLFFYSNLDKNIKYYDGTLVPRNLNYLENGNWISRPQFFTSDFVRIQSSYLSNAGNLLYSIIESNGASYYHGIYLMSWNGYVSQVDPQYSVFSPTTTAVSVGFSDIVDGGGNSSMINGYYITNGSNNIIGINNNATFNFGYNIVGSPAAHVLYYSNFYKRLYVASSNERNHPSLPYPMPENHKEIWIADYGGTPPPVPVTCDDVVVTGSPMTTGSISINARGSSPTPTGNVTFALTGGSGASATNFSRVVTASANPTGSSNWNAAVTLSPSDFRPPSNANNLAGQGPITITVRTTPPGGSSPSCPIRTFQVNIPSNVGTCGIAQINFNPALRNFVISPTNKNALFQLLGTTGNPFIRPNISMTIDSQVFPASYTGTGLTVSTPNTNWWQDFNVNIDNSFFTNLDTAKTLNYVINFDSASGVRSVCGSGQITYTPYSPPDLLTGIGQTNLSCTVNTNPYNTRLNIVAIPSGVSGARINRIDTVIYPNTNGYLGIVFQPSLAVGGVTDPSPNYLHITTNVSLSGTLTNTTAVLNSPFNVTGITGSQSGAQQTINYPLSVGNRTNYEKFLLNGFNIMVRVQDTTGRSAVEYVTGGLSNLVPIENCTEGLYVKSVNGDYRQIDGDGNSVGQYFLGVGGIGTDKYSDYSRVNFGKASDWLYEFQSSTSIDDRCSISPLNCIKFPNTNPPQQPVRQLGVVKNLRDKLAEITNASPEYHVVEIATSTSTIDLSIYKTPSLNGKKKLIIKIPDKGNYTIKNQTVTDASTVFVNCEKGCNLTLDNTSSSATDLSGANNSYSFSSSLSDKKLIVVNYSADSEVPYIRLNSLNPANRSIYLGSLLTNGYLVTDQSPKVNSIYGMVVSKGIVLNSSNSSKKGLYFRDFIGTSSGVVPILLVEYDPAYIFLTNNLLTRPADTVPRRIVGL